MGTGTRHDHADLRICLAGRHPAAQEAMDSPRERLIAASRARRDASRKTSAESEHAVQQRKLAEGAKRVVGLLGRVRALQARRRDHDSS